MENMKTNLPSENTEKEEMTSNYKVTKKDIRKANIRWLFGSQICWNYEKMMAPGYIYSMLPLLKKFYKGKELKEMMRTHMQFFNTNPMVGGLILGMNIAVEEKEGSKGKDAVVGLKTGLMGSFAGVGDTIFGVIIPTIFGSIAAYMALEGSPAGVLIWILANLAVIILRLTFMPFAYKQGASLVTKFSDKLNALTDAAILLGLTVIGALIPTVVKAEVPFVYSSGEVKLVIQDMLNQIMPSLIPVLIVGLVYWLLGRKKMSSTKAILFVMLLSILLYNLNILG